MSKHARLTVPMIRRAIALVDADLSYAAAARVLELDWGQPVSEHTVRRHVTLYRHRVGLPSRERARGIVGLAKPGSGVNLPSKAAA